MLLAFSTLLLLAAAPTPSDAGVPRADGVAAQAAPAPAAAAPVIATPPMEELVVTGSRTERKRADSTAAVEVIDRKEIVATGASNVAEVLETHPGVDLERAYRGQTVRLQGMDPEYVLVLVDGQRTLGRLGGSLDISRYSTDDVERIEIVKGAASALYGSDAVAGVINIITRQASRRVEAGGRVSGGSLGALDATYRVGVRRESYDALLTYGHHRGDAWDLTPATVDTTAPGFRSHDLALRTSWRPTSTFTLGAKGAYMRRDQTGVGGSGTGAVFDNRTRSEEAGVTVIPEWRFAGGSRLQLNAHYGLYYDQLLSDQRGSDMMDLFEKAKEHLVQLGAQHDLKITGRHTLTSGAEVLVEDMEGQRIAGGSQQRTRGALYLQHEWRLLEQPRLTLLPGARLDADSQFGVHASPKLAVRFDPHPTVALRAAYGWAYRAPSFQELYFAFNNVAVGYMVAGNSQLQPESSRSLTLGAEWRPTARVLLSFGLFRNDIDDLINVRLTNPDEVGVPSRYTYDNVASAYTQGGEAGLGVELFTGLRADLSYTLTIARDQEADRDLEGRARHRGTFRLGYRHPGARFGAQARGSLVGRRPYYTDDNNDGTLETLYTERYVTTGVRVTQGIWRKIEAFLGADNLLGAGEALYTPITPRTYYGGLEFSY